MNWGLYDRKLTSTGYTARDRQINQEKEDFERESVKNPAFHVASRNGVKQRFLITRTEVPEKYKIVAFPDEELCSGDYIDVFGERFIVVQVRIEDTIQKNGVMWLCNYEFKWQSFNSDVITRWGVLDSGVYSSTIRGENMARYTDKQFKLYLPLDAETRKLFIDKRLAVDTMVDKFGNDVLVVYQITGYDGVSESFGRGSHLLVANLRSDEYNAKTDNTELMICDYISPISSSENELSCKIIGSNYIRLGTSRTYKPEFYINGEKQNDIVPIWSVGEPQDGITTKENNGYLTISVADDQDLVDESIVLYLVDENELYTPYSITIDIIGL